jgi:transketolase
VIDLYSIKRLDQMVIEPAAEETRAIVVAEEHLIATGLGVRVVQVVTATRPCAMEFLGTHDTYAESGVP